MVSRSASVILFLLCWQSIGGQDLENISIESVLDQVAIPTKIINDFLKKPVKTSVSKKLPSNEHVESTTIHYENSNGFVPLIVSTQPYEFKQNKRNLTSDERDTINNTKTKARNAVEEDPAFSTEARIFFNLPNPSQNRRSFHADENEDEFELLKVSNGTPAVANYNSFYEHSKDIQEQDYSLSDSNYKKSLRNKDRDRGKRIQSYLGTYEATNEDKPQYGQSGTSGDEKKDHQQERGPTHYKQDNTGNYRPQKERPSPSRTHYGATTTTKSSIKAHTTTAEKNEEHRFKNPIMVEPNEYKVDIRFSGQSVQTVVSTPNPHSDLKDQIDSIDTENRDDVRDDQLSQIEGTSRNYESADSRDFSDENSDYMYEMEKPRRVQKTSRRRPHHFDSSRKLPKEHREVYDDEYDDQGRKRSRSKSRYRQKPKQVQVVNEDEQYVNDYDNLEENANNGNKQQNFNEENTWSQVAPNVEVSHSNGFEINQIEKPKLHIVPVNLLSNFDHATALDNSQGFDITNAMFTGFVREGSLVSTAAPLLSSSPNYIDQNLVSSSTTKPPIGGSSSVPDVIVGQSSFHNPVQAVLMPNKLQPNMVSQYMQSTVAPAVFTVTSRPSYAGSSSIAPNLQQMLNQVHTSFPINQQFVTAQPTRQTLTNLLQSVQSNGNNQIYVNSNGLQGQNLYQIQSMQSTTNSPNSDRSESQNKKVHGNNGQFVASASLSVGQGAKRKLKTDTKSDKRNNNNNNNDDSHYNGQTNQQTTRQSLNAFVQPTVVPAILHTGIGLINNQNPQLLQNQLFIANPQQSPQVFKATNDAFENTMRQLQYDIQNNRYQLAGISGADSIGGASNNINAINNLINPIQKAQLPILGAKNVEIINPNLNANAYAINQIPAALVTTPIPIFTTTNFITPKHAFSTTTQEPQVSVHNFVDTLTEIGTKRPKLYRNLNVNSFINLQGHDRPLYNPINFVPNYDLVKSQSILNNNVAASDPYAQQNLNLVPLVPGGNFYKHSQIAQLDLANKPKLSSDLEKYAEEMFKESLRTIYNSHKWNNDLRSPGNISLVDNSDLAKLRNELLRIRNSMRDSKVPKDVLEAHYTENKIRTAHPGSDYKRPDSSIEQPYKHDHKSHSGIASKPHHHHHHHSHHHHRHKPEINDFLTPPRVNSFVSKSPFLDKPPKKRPGHGPRPNFNHENSRPRPRQGVVSSKPKSLETQPSTMVDYRYPMRSQQEKVQYSQPDYGSGQSYNYPTFTTSYPENEPFRSSAEYRSSSERDFYDINHQRTHNFMGLLMKNKQLPPGTQGNYYNDRYAISQMLDDENRQAQSQAYDDVFRSFQTKSDRYVRPIPLNKISRRAYVNAYHQV